MPSARRTSPHWTAWFPPGSVPTRTRCPCDPACLQIDVCYVIMQAMPVQITIRGVPEVVRDELAAKAALNRQSMQEYLRCELERIASRPSLATLVAEVRRRKEAAGTSIPSSLIVEARDADRT